ncbi:hypothetical protein CAEBREN_03114 [Caenorhabditis brenneri]|uniref:Uncharacterized protein n=1 Tax=Caenorhabditis brenneri TaxID=135651 RepID=G0NH04_CAEBE|nr:hypothetical protein CAEBREN_03114 [Caenorhabditis brenneri]
MGRGKNVQECDGASLRRSTRKRTLKKDDDFEYDLDCPKFEVQPFSSPTAHMVKTLTVKKQTTTTSSLKKAKQYRTQIAPEPAAYEEIREYNYDGIDDDFQRDISYESDYYRDMVVYDRHHFMMNNVVRLQTSDLISMDFSEIIDVHCNNLMLKFENVAHSLFNSWNVPSPIFCPPNVFLGSNSSRYSHLESDESAVKKVVEAMLKTVSFLQK